MMAQREMYVVLLREQGLFLVEPVAGQTQAERVEAVLHVDGGYSAGLAQVDVTEGATEAWVAWVEGETPAGQPYFEYRTFDASLSEQQVEERCSEAGETVLKLHRSEIYWQA